MASISDQSLFSGKYSRLASLSLFAATLIVSATATSHAQDAKQRAFLKKLEGEWCGPGEIIAGKYKDTKFKCNLSLSDLGAAKTVKMSGNCSVGVFKKNMVGDIKFSGSKVRGDFLNGATDEGLDITAGRLSGNRLDLSIKREKIVGNVRLHLAGVGKLNNTVSVKVGKDTVPVIGMALTACGK